MLTALGLLGVVALIAANGYFVAVEFAFVAARRSRFLERAEEGDRGSKRAIDVHKRLSFMLSGAQLGITVTTLLLGFIAEPAVASVIEPALVAVGVPASATFGISLTLALILATVAQMVFGELAPKNLAIAKPEPVARTLAPSMWLYLRIAGPVVRLFDGAANRLLRLVGVEPVEELRGAVSTEELDLIVDSSAESGHLTAGQAALLERAIDFGELEASDAMVPWNRVVTIGSSATGADLRDLMASTHSRFPVVDVDGHVLGIVHAKDLLGVGRSDYETTSVSQLFHEILAVPGVDAIYIGPADLSRTLGLPPLGDHDDPLFTDALDVILAACRKAGVPAGIHANPTIVQKRLDQGFQMVTATSDLLAVMAGAKAALAGEGSSSLY